MRFRTRLLSALALACSTAAAGAQGWVTTRGQEFMITEGGRTRPFVPWGYNYDRTVIAGRDLLLEDLLREQPDKLSEDFAAMRRMGGNTVRLFLATAEILAGPEAINPDGLSRLDTTLRAARAAGLHVILVGLANLRPATAPKWLQEADDETIERAERLFWRTVARHCRDEPAILAYDLQNEPAIHYSESRDLVVGCFEMSQGQKFCYVHMHYRQPQKRWTAHIHAKFGTEQRLREHWKDYPRQGESWDAIAIPANDPSAPRRGEYIAFHGHLLGEWASGLATVIRSEDPRHLITVGALDARPMAKAVDFYCLHLYPKGVEKGQDFLEGNSRRWRQRLEALPPDKPLIMEEFYPMALPPTGGPEAVIGQFLKVTRARAAGWIGFYWGPAESLNFPMEFFRGMYQDTLNSWSRHSPERTATRAAASRPATNEHR